MSVSSEFNENNMPFQHNYLAAPLFFRKIEDFLPSAMSR
jgi:hypothetical protein